MAGQGNAGREPIEQELAEQESNGGGRLRKLMELIRREPGLARNMITLGVLIVLGLSVGGFVLGHQRFNSPFEDNTFFYATFNEAPAIAPGRGNEIRINGVTVGDLREARINKRGQAQVLLALDKEKYPGRVYDNATVLLRPKSPLNEMYVELNPGGAPGRALAQNAVLPVQNSRAPVEIDQPLGHLDAQTRESVRALLSASDVALARMPQDLPGGLRATDTLVRNMRPVVTQLDARRAKIRSLVTAVAELSHSLGSDDRRLADLANALQITLNSVADRGDELRASLNRLPGFVTELNRATGSIGSLSDQLDPTLDDVRAASKSLPGSLRKLTNTIDTLNTTVHRARPVARKLPAVVADMRPFISDLNTGLPDLRSTTRQLNPITAGVVPYLPDLGAFVYNTSSLTSLQDANGGILRGLLVGGPSSVPLKGTSDLSPTQK